MTNLKLAFRTLFKTPFVTAVAILSLALGIGANAAIFSLFNQMLLRPLPVPAPHELVNLAAPGPKPGSQVVQPGRRLRRGLQLPDVPRPREGADRLHRHRRARMFGANLAYHGQTLNGAGHARVGQLFPGARRAAGARPAARRPTTIRTSANRRSSCSATPTGRRASTAIRTCSNETLIVNGQTDHRRRRAARASTARRSAPSRRSSCRSRCAA